MPLLENHLEQISQSAAALADLPFPGPKIFTNALLYSHDITALIRDTDVHERALFTLAASAPSPKTASRNSTAHNASRSHRNYANGISLNRPSKTGSAVATLLAGKLGEEIKKSGITEGKERGDIDVNILLDGATKLCKIYPFPGSLERIASLRERFQTLSSSVSRYEQQVFNQTAKLASLNRTIDDGFEEDSRLNNRKTTLTPISGSDAPVTLEDIRKEEEEIKKLERKKRTLEDRVSAMERDLGGLLR